MGADDWWRLVLLLILMVVGAAGALAEFSLPALNRLRFRRLLEDSERRSAAVSKLLQQQQQALVSVLLLTTVALVSVSFLSAAIWRADGELLFLVAAVLGTSVALVFFCRILPGAYATQSPERVAALLAGPVAAASLLLSPIIRPLSAAADLVLPLMGARRLSDSPLVSEDELRLLVSLGEDNGAMEQDEKEMIQGVFGLEDTAVREIMVPRIDISAVETDQSMTDAVDLIIKRGFSRIPLYEGSLDNIVGVLYAKDLLRHLRAGPPLPKLIEIARPTYFIPESKRVDDLLRDLQQKKVHIAIVVDEYGGTAGMVTIEDLLEEIVGDIQDEYDKEESQIEQISPDEAVFDGRVPIDELNKVFGLCIEPESFDTVGGYVYNQLGKIPVVGDSVLAGDLLMTVESVGGKRIGRVRVLRQPASSASSG